MLTREVKERIADFFTATELVDFLCVEVEDVIDTFEEVIEEALDDIEEFMGLRTNDGEEEDDE